MVRCSDSPFSLVAAALQSIPVLAGTEKTGFDFTLYTGDLVSHDSENQLSRYFGIHRPVYAHMLTMVFRDYVMYTEVCFFPQHIENTFTKSLLGSDLRPFQKAARLWSCLRGAWQP